MKKIQNVIVDAMPSPAHLPNGTIYGYYSAYLPQKIKLIPEAHFIKRDGHEGTQTSLTRAWIKDNLPKRICRKPELAAYQWASSPLYAKPHHFDDCVYIDIKSAYSSVYSVLGWGVDYLRGVYLAPAPQPLIYPYQDLKVSRSYVVTGSRHKSHFTVVKDGILKTSQRFNLQSNPSLVGAVLDILSMVARFAVYSCGAAYYNTDGAIMSAEAGTVYSEFLTSLKLPHAIKYSGEGWISNVNNWQVGDHTVRRGDIHSPQGFKRGDWISLSPSEAEWLYIKYRDITAHR